MTLSFVNGIQLGGETPTSNPYAHGARHMRRWLWNWMTKVIGYQDIEKSGANYDNPELGPLTDGATDTSNVRRFTSATAVFTSAMEGSHLGVFPTAAPAVTGGFADPTRNGFYQIKRVIDDNTVEVEVFNGVHSDGLPLNESGLRFEVHRFKDASNLITPGNYAVMRGTGIGGAFDIQMREHVGVSYAPTSFIVSPFADWVAGAPGSFSPATRVTAETVDGHSFNSDVAWVWAIGDLTRVIVWVRYFHATAHTWQDGEFIYVGDLAAFHPASDPRPVVAANGSLGSSLDEYPAISHGVNSLAADDTTQITSQLLFPSHEAGSGTPFHGFSDTTRSSHSGRFVRAPLIVAEESAGNEEIRGQLKGVEMGHFYGPRGPIPIGAARDRIRFFTQFIAPWNGSKIFRYVY